MRHLISGEDCAIAGEASAAAAAPVAETFKKSRRFIKAASLVGCFPFVCPGGANTLRKQVGRAFNTEGGRRKRNIRMIGVIKPKSHSAEGGFRRPRLRPLADRGPWRRSRDRSQRAARLAH